ncbi:minor tail protein [Escherichia coli]|nr:minor tail protein [Escherichia coli]
MMSCTLTSDIWKRHPCFGDVAMAFPSLKGTLASPETEMQQIRREVMLGWPADALNQATNRVLIFQYAG